MADPTGDPSAREFQLPTSPDEHEIRLVDYWRVLVQRRLVFLTVLAITVTATLVITLLKTPLYTASSTIEIGRKGPDILTSKDVVGVDPSYAGYQDFYQTQYKLLQSRAVLRIAAERLDLAARPEYATRRASPVKRLIGWVRSFGGGDGGPPPDPTDAAASFIGGVLRVQPIRSSHLVRVTVTDRSPVLAADIANAVSDAYQRFQLDARYDTTGKAKEFLAKDVALVRSEIAELQRQLQAYGVENELLGLSDGVQDISEQALADINTRYTDARTRLAAVEARYQSVESAPPEAFPEVLNSATVNELRQRHAELERGLAQMRERFASDWPPLQQLRSEVETARQQIETEETKIAEQVRFVAQSDYERTRAEMVLLKRQHDLQKHEVQRVNLDTIEYAGLKAEIDTKRQVLADLAARQSETETSYRLKETSTSNIRVVDLAQVPEVPSSPNKRMNLAIALFLGCVLGAAAAFFFDHLDNSIKNELDLERYSKLPALGHVPLTHSLRLVNATEDSGDEDITPQLDLASHLDPRSSFAESCRSLRTSLLLATPDHPPRHVAITSCEPADGKSTIAMNLAIVLTQLGRRVLLVDADLRRPRLHKSMQVPNDMGLSSYLSGNAAAEELTQETVVPNLKIITSGPIPPNPSELLGSPALDNLLDRFRQDDAFDHVIFDSPPLLSVTDTTILSTRMDSMILVVRSGQTRRESLIQSAQKLRQSRAKVSGAVLNAVSTERGGYYYGRYGGSQYGYGSETPTEPRKRNRRGNRRAG